MRDAKSIRLDEGVVLCFGACNQCNRKFSQMNETGVGQKLCRSVPNWSSAGGREEQPDQYEAPAPRKRNRRCSGNLSS